VRAEPELGFHLFAASWAGVERPGAERTWLRPPRLVKNRTASLAFEEALSPFHRNQRDKKEAYVMVQPLQSSCRMATAWTGSGLFVKSDLPGLQSTDEDEGESPPFLRKR